MQTTTYRNYPLLEKVLHIHGVQKSDAPRSTSHSWEKSGRGNIEELAKQEGLLELVYFNNQLNSNMSDAILHTLDFFMETIHQKKSLKKRFKSQRKECMLMINALKKFIDLDKLLVIFNMTRQTYTNLHNKYCSMSPTKICLNTALNQFTFSDEDKLKLLYFNNEKYNDFALSDLFCEVVIDKEVFISYTKFREIAVKLGEYAKRKRVYKATKKKGKKASRPNEIIHADKTMYKLANGTKLWIYLVCDNYSRRILSAHVSYSSKSAESLHTLKLAITNNNLKNVNFIYLTDDGSENKHLVKEYIATMPNIKHRIAQTPSWIHSNSMIESIIKYFKNAILLRKEFKTIEQLITATNDGVITYNNRRRRFLNAGNPNEFYDGNEPNMEEYKRLYKEATKKRMQENKEYNCLKPCPDVFENQHLYYR